MNIKDKIINHCCQNLKEEICGFVVKNEDDFEIKPVDNKAINKEREFYIPAKEYLSIKRKNEIVAIYHSHPQGKATPSEYDKKTSENICLPFVIFSADHNNFFLYRPENSDADEERVQKLEKELI